MSEKKTLSELRVRRGTPADVPAILELMALSLGEGSAPRTRAYWNWKHEANPFGTSPVLVAEADGALVGLRVFMRWTWQSGREEVRAVRAVDTATHPGWRGQGIFTRLTLQLVEQMAEEDVAFVFNTPNSKSRPGYLKMGWSTQGRLSLWIRPLRPLRCLKAALFPDRSATEGQRQKTGFAPEDFPSAAQLLAQPELPGLLQRLGLEGTRYATPRSVEYMRWRYEAIPEFAYSALWDFDGADGAALVFRGRLRRGLRELSLSEVLIGPTAKSREMGRALMQALAQRTRADYLVAMAAQGTPERFAVGLQTGFLPAPRLGLHFTVRRTETPAHLPVPERRANWRCSIGDLEIF